MLNVGCFLSVLIAADYAAVASWLGKWSCRPVVLLLPGIVVGAVLGIVLHKRVDARQFTGIIYVLLALAGAELCYKGLTALLG